MTMCLLVVVHRGCSLGAEILVVSQRGRGWLRVVEAANTLRVTLVATCDRVTLLMKSLGVDIAPVRDAGWWGRAPESLSYGGKAAFVKSW
ncbi:hypothetical protein B0O80DRAFT_441243 [Mortierella sp. GBAus27b]|nr:hypothetical protein B0O80DRAFT_441243 [Mortierella sp. GBAus27b]